MQHHVIEFIISCVPCQRATWPEVQLPPSYHHLARVFKKCLWMGMSHPHNTSLKKTVSTLWILFSHQIQFPSSTSVSSPPLRRYLQEEEKKKSYRNLNQLSLHGAAFRFWFLHTRNLYKKYVYFFYRATVNGIIKTLSLVEFVSSNWAHLFLYKEISQFGA